MKVDLSSKNLSVLLKLITTTIVEEGKEAEYIHAEAELIKEKKSKLSSVNRKRIVLLDYLLKEKENAVNSEVKQV